MVREDKQLNKEVGGGFAIKGDIAPLSARPSVNSKLDQQDDIHLQVPTPEDRESLARNFPTPSNPDPEE